MTHRVSAPRRPRRGYVLVFALVTIGLLVVLGGALLAMANTSYRTAYRRIENAQALNLAMGGMDEAVARLELNKSYTGFADRTLGGGTVTVTVTTPSGVNSRRVIVSTGTIQGSNHTVVRSVRGTMEVGPTPPVFYRALAGKSSFVINGNVDVASGPTLHVGDVHCNANVELVGSSVTIDGNVTASGVVTTTGSPTVTGTMASGVPPMTFPEVDQEFKDRSLVNGITSGSLTVNDGSVIQGKISGSLRVEEPDGCVLNGVVWVTGSVTIEGPVRGVGTLVCDGNIIIDARNSYPADDVSRLAFITTSTDPNQAVDLGGNRQFKGIVYAPYGGVNLHGTPSLLGQIIANHVNFSGTPDITRLTDVDNNPPPLPPVFQLKGWEEL